MGEVRAETDSPSALDRIILDIPSQQVVGHPWAGPVQILLLDENLDLVTNYNLNVDPITLTISSGLISPSVISDSLLFSDGVVDLTAVGLTYHGLTGPATITASNSTTTSGGLLVTFNGCDVLEVVGLADDTVSTVYSGVSSSVAVVTGHAGDLTATAAPSLKAFFRSGGGSIRTEFEASQQDTAVINLPTSGLVPGVDTLVLITESVFDLGSGDLSTGDTLRIPINVLASDGLTIVPGSLTPDSVYASVPFDLAMSVVAQGMQAPFDSAVASVSLLSASDSVLAIIFDGAIGPDRIDGDTLLYSGLPAQVHTTPDLPAGRYGLTTDYQLHIGGLTLAAVESGRDSLDIVDPAPLSYVSLSLTPNQIASGAEAELQFELYLGGSESVHLHPEQSNIEILTNDFSATAQLYASSDSLFAGNNLIQSGKLYVPAGLLGADLSVRAEVAYHHAGVANKLQFATDFDGETVAVQALPLVKIVEAFIVSPNAPKVNSGQPFRVACRVANVSPTDAAPFELILATDGDSQFDSLLTTEAIAAGDTAEVYFDVVASSSSNASEIFRVEVAPFTIAHILPDDNIALATVQRPAELAVSLMLIGADEGWVDVGGRFDLLIGLVNVGEGEASDGRFRINTNSIYLGLPDSALVIEEVVSVGTVRGISFDAPDYDTAIVIDVDLVVCPIDLNTGLRALIGDTAFQVELAIISQVLALGVELEVVTSNLVVAGEEKELFRLRVTNPGSSSVSDIQLESMVFHFDAAGNTSSTVRQLIEVGSTGLYEDGQRLTQATAGDDLLRLTFENFVVVAAETVELSFRTKSRTEVGSEFSVTLDVEDIAARYAAGPLAGQPVAATTTGEDQSVVGEVFTAVMGDLENSLVVRQNPFDPMAGPAEFRYYLEQAQAMHLSVLTLSGELVYDKLFEADAMGGRVGENTLFWNGRNGRGEIVLNGVYIVVISDESGRRQAVLKLAVMK